MSHGSRTGREDGLTELERRFCEAFVGEAKGVATYAYKLAGYSQNSQPQTMRRNAHALMRKPHIKAYLQELQENDPLVATRIERLQFLTRVMRGEETNPVWVRDFPEPIPSPPSIRDRLSAAEALAKAAGEHIQKVEMKVQDDSANLSTAELKRRVLDIVTALPDEAEPDTVEGDPSDQDAT